MSGIDGEDFYRVAHGTTEPPAAVPQTLTGRLLTRAQLATLPTPSPLIADTLDLGTVSVLAGYWGTLKSFIAMDWAASIATGRPWMGRATQQHRVLYVAAEGAHGMHDRLTSWETAWRRDIPTEQLTVLPAAAHLGNHVDVLELCHIITTGKFNYVVIDTLAKSITGMDENSAKDMGVAVGALYQIGEATEGGTVTALHHTGKDKTTVRGSSALEAGVDTVYTTEGTSHSLTLARTKRKDGPQADTMHLRFHPVPGTSSGVVESQTAVGISHSQGELLSHFRSHFSATGASRSMVRDSLSMSSSTFYRTVNALVSEGMLINEGTDKQPFYRLPGG